MTQVPVRHHPGRHCASTGAANLANFHRLPWSEALCFGLGGGLGMFYMNFPGLTPSRLVHVRSADYEHNFFSRLGQRFRWQQFSDPAQGEAALCAALDEGRPVIVQTDIFYLPYFKSTTHFPGHVITVWGYDADREVFYVTDTDRPDVLEVGFAEMRCARHSSKGPFPLQGNLYAPTELQEPADLTDRLARAIVDNSRSLLNSRIKMQGVPGLMTWLAELDAWQDLDDWQWCARFTYQIIEKRGTGGGGFRLMYADFLDEAATHLPQIAAVELDSQMRRLAAAWTELALSLRQVSEAPAPDFAPVRPHLQAVLAQERIYHERVLETFDI